MRPSVPAEKTRPAGGESRPVAGPQAVDALARAALKLPIHIYRWTLRPWLGWPCRHLPTCSDYALEAIDQNGAWRGLWLTVSRLARCQPWGSAGHDPVPDIRSHHHPLAPWRYGRWSGRHIATRWDEVSSGVDKPKDRA
jgi:putative membrane protein insertion efficiency factor